MSLIEIATDVAQRIRDTKTDTITRIKDFVNEAYLDMWNRSNWRFAIVSGETLTTEASIAEYALPYDIERILYIGIESLRYALKELDWVDLREAELLGVTGRPEAYALGGLAGVTRQPATASQISIVSSSDSDTSQTVTIIGVVSGTVQTETVTLSGISTKTTTASFSRIIRVAKNAETAGIVTLSAGVDTLLMLAPAQLTVDYKLIRLYPTPSSVYTITYDYRRRVQNLTEDRDVPLLPVHTWTVLKDGATMRALSWQKPDNLKEINHYQTLYEEGLRRMMTTEGRWAEGRWTVKGTFNETNEHKNLESYPRIIPTP